MYYEQFCLYVHPGPGGKNIESWVLLSPSCVGDDMGEGGEGARSQVKIKIHIYVCVCVLYRLMCALS